jgi:hypothetical protein
MPSSTLMYQIFFVILFLYGKPQELIFYILLSELMLVVVRAYYDGFC